MTERRLWTQQVHSIWFQEDTIIKELVEKHGGKKWTQIAIDMKGLHPHLARSSKQIR